jgi:hypothetical protein
MNFRFVIFKKWFFRLSQLSWADIRQQDRHKLGYEKISRSSIKAAIPAHVTEDVELFAFRFCSKARMVGYKRNATFYVLWLDRSFTLYNYFLRVPILSSETTLLDYHQH